MQDIEQTVVRHEENIKQIYEQINDIRQNATEIRSLSLSISELVVELRHTNNHIKTHEARLSALEKRPSLWMDKLINIVLTAIVGGVVGYMLSFLLRRG